MIEREHGAPVATLFEVYGQGTFRRYERDCLTRIVAAHEAAVIATAGGIVADDATFAQLLDQTHVDLAAGLARRAHAPRDGAGRLPPDGAQSRRHERPGRDPRGARAPTTAASHARLDTSGKSVEACVARAGDDCRAVVREVCRSCPARKRPTSVERTRRRSSTSALRRGSKLDNRVRKLVAIDRTGREVLRQNRCAFLDRADQAVGCVPARKCGCQRCHDVVPHLGTYLLINAGVGQTSA